MDRDSRPARARALPGTAGPAAEPKLDTDEQKTVYAIGLASPQSLQPYDLTPDEIELVQGRPQPTAS